MKMTAELIAYLLNAGQYASVTEAQFTDALLLRAKERGFRTAHFRPARLLDKNGVVRWRTAVSGDGKGWPDVVLTRGARLIVAELKVGKNKTSPEQDAWLAAFEECGAEVFLWTPADWPKIEEVLS